MSSNVRSGVVIFTGDLQRLAKFYEAMTGLSVHFTDEKHTVLASENFELVIHAISGESKVTEPVVARQDTYIKPFFPVASIAQARDRAAALGGKLHPADTEWEARGFRACDAIDPDGNVIQFREDAE